MRSDTNVAILFDGNELLNTDLLASEDMLASAVSAKLGGRYPVRMLIGG